MRGLRGSSLPAPFSPSLNNPSYGASPSPDHLYPRVNSVLSLSNPFPSLNLVNSESDNPLSFRHQLGAVPPNRDEMFLWERMCLAQTALSHELQLPLTIPGSGFRPRSLSNPGYRLWLGSDRRAAYLLCVALPCTLADIRSRVNDPIRCTHILARKADARHYLVMSTLLTESSSRPDPRRGPRPPWPTQIHAAHAAKLGTRSKGASLWPSLRNTRTFQLTLMDKPLYYTTHQRVCWRCCHPVGKQGGLSTGYGLSRYK